MGTSSPSTSMSAFRVRCPGRAARRQPGSSPTAPGGTRVRGARNRRAPARLRRHPVRAHRSAPVAPRCRALGARSRWPGRSEQRSARPRHVALWWPQQSRTGSHPTPGPKRHGDHGSRRRSLPRRTAAIRLSARAVGPHPNPEKARLGATLIVSSPTPIRRRSSIGYSLNDWPVRVTPRSPAVSTPRGSRHPPSAIAVATRTATGPDGQTLPSERSCATLATPATRCSDASGATRADRSLLPCRRSRPAHALERSLIVDLVARAHA